MKDYSKGKIYKIVSDSTDDIYIGSTVQTLSQRLTKHRSDYKQWKKGNHYHTRSFSLLERGDYHIILLEPFPCANQEELTARERWYIDNNKCLNKVKPGRKKKEYYQDNKEMINRQAKEYYQDNKERIKEIMKEYRQDNKDKIKEWRKEYNQDNKEKIKEQKKEYRKLTFQCLCDGEQYNLNNKSHHFKTQYHITNLKTICDIYGVDPNEL
jgi:hypothetical protein